MAYTNTAANAPWLATEFQDVPWDITPTLAALPGFQVQMLELDLLHIFHLGVGRDLVGSALRVICQTNVFAGRNLDLKLQSATGWLKAFAKQRKLTLVLKKLTKTNLNWKSNEYPEAHCKGFDTYVLLTWLVKAVLESPHAHEIPDDVRTALWAADSLASMLMNGTQFLSEQERVHKETIGMMFIRVYVRLAGQAIGNRQRLWKIRPKIHLLQHLVMGEKKYNVHYTSTWMDEDAVKKFMHVKRKVHKRTATEQTIKRWLLALKPKLVDACAKKRRNNALQKPDVFKNLASLCFHRVFFREHALQKTGHQMCSCNLHTYTRCKYIYHMSILFIHIYIVLFCINVYRYTCRNINMYIYIVTYIFLH